MLWTFLRNLLTKPTCEGCSAPLGALKVFCQSCQTDCYYQLMNLLDYSSLNGNHLYIQLDRIQSLKRLKALAENPRQLFLSEHLATLLMFALNEQDQFKVKGVIVNPLFNQRKQNQNFYKYLKDVWKLKLEYGDQLDSPHSKLVFLVA